MSDISNYESRTGIVSCSPQGVFNFVTDLRNFNQFIPKDTINNWHAERESCSFNVAMAGTISVLLAEKETNNKVTYTGDALKKNDFTIILNIKSSGTDSSEVKLSLNADLNPVLKMMAAKPIEQFLGILITEMEKFGEWENIKG
jgi:carbon monoxide dehydrogenase subunit G